MRSCRGVVLATTLMFVVLGLLAASSSASAQDTGWLVESFDVRIDVAPDGSLAVEESIAVDFRTLSKHGIYRVIPVRYGLPPEVQFDLPEGRGPEQFVRALDIDAISVTSQSAPDEVEIERPGPFPSEGGTVSIRIGDPDETVTGRHTYVIRYEVRGAMNGFGAPPELQWNVTGNAWPVPIASATATVTGGDPQRLACFRGQFGASDTCAARHDGRGASFEAEALLPGEGMTAVVGFAPGSVAVRAPILLERWSFPRAFAGSGWAVPVAFLLGLLGVGGVAALLRREGRDRVARGGATVDGRRDSGTGSRTLGPFERRAVPVQFRPPDGLRPAQVGLLIDERVDAVDISATVVDLSVRGWLLIEEQESKVLWFSRTDWELARTNGPRDPEDALLPYEQKLLDGLFEDGDRVAVSDLRGSFAETYQEVEDDLYDLGRDEGWFPRRPDRVRAMWLSIGIGLTVLGVGAFVLGMVFTTAAVLALPVLLVGLLVAGSARWMPHRTAEGSRLFDGTLGFREFIVTAETDRMDFAEAEQLFVAYLPYAVVFGAVDRWAGVFAELGVATSTAVAGWYVGAHGFDAARFSSGLSDFSSTLGTSLSTVPSSGGSSGFSGGSSGGGFGGGGGGSW